MKVLVLGHRGLLGNMVHAFLSKQEQLNVVTIDHILRWPSSEFKQSVLDADVHYIVNCIGAIHQKTSEFAVNHELPRWLDSLGCRIIHAGTDCESDGDEYGISKKTAREFIVTEGINTRIIKTSIIGPELNTNYSLFNWFLSNEDGTTVNGFANQYWNGNTTLQWSKFCLYLINNWDSFQIENIIATECISKYDLLSKINAIFDRRIRIIKLDGTTKNKCLEGTSVGRIDEQLIELKQFMYENN